MKKFINALSVILGIVGTIAETALIVMGILFIINGETIEGILIIIAIQVIEIRFMIKKK